MNGEEGAGAGSGESGGEVEEGQQEKTGSDGEMLSGPAEGRGHRELHHRGKDGESRLRATHDLFGNDGHQGRLRDNAGKCAKETKGGLQRDGANQNRYVGHGNVADSHASHRRNV